MKRTYMAILENIEKLKKAILINDKVVDQSIIMDDNTKKAFIYNSNYIRSVLYRESNINSYSLNSLKNELLIYWNESINPDTEYFWNELLLEGIDYVRKEPLKFALLKNRFRRVDQGIDARKHWAKLKKLKSIQEKYSEYEIKKIDDIISNDESRRLDILKKCLRKNQIPQTQYLKFGECMAYMKECKLWENYFSNEEVNMLYRIWNDFKSR